MRSCMKPLVVIWLMAALGFWGFSLVWADEGPPLGPRTIVVALDGTGDFVSLQEAVDAARKGDTVFVNPGQYPQDVTIHSKEKIKLVGAGVDQVTILGRDIVVGALHVGKWPYGGARRPALSLPIQKPSSSGILFMITIMASRLPESRMCGWSET